MPGIFYYVSGHGFGHAVRAAEVIAALGCVLPDVPVWVRTTAPASLFPRSSTIEPASLDLGVLQQGSLHLRPGATLRTYADLVSSEPERIATEVALARERGVDCIVADIPSAAFEIAAALGVPGIGVANFCWHWIYEPYLRSFPHYQWVVDHIRRQESLATLLLRLPFAWEFDCFPHRIDVPLIGRPATRSRAEVREQLGIADHERAALLSFGGFGLDMRGEARLAKWKDWLFVSTESSRPPGRIGNLLNVCATSLPYVDIMRAMDAVVTKPGFGIVSDALVNRVPVLYADRGAFREHGVLARALRSQGRAKHIRRTELLAGNLGPSLERLMELQTPWSPVAWNGAEVIATRIAEAREAGR